VTGTHSETTALLWGAVVLCSAIACGEPHVTGEGQFGRGIALLSDPLDPLPRLVWRPGEACPGPVGGCESFCEGPTDQCPADACRPLLIDSGTPVTLLPSTTGSLSLGRECIELRAGAGLLENPSDPDVLAGTTASFRLLGAPVVRATRQDGDPWTWEAGDELDPAQIGGVIGGNVLRDFAVALRHHAEASPSITFYTQFPGSEEVLADQGRAFLRLQFPGRLLGRLLNDHCEYGDGVDCRLSRLSLSQSDQELLYESTRALVDACVAPPPCAVSWSNNKCRLRTGGATPQECQLEQGGSATLLVATGVPGLVLFEDSATQLLGPLESLPTCDAFDGNAETKACLVGTSGRLVLPGWAPLESLQRVRVRSVGIVEGLTEASGPSPCTRLRDRLEGAIRQCEWFAAEGRPIRPFDSQGESIGSSAVVFGEASLGEFAEAPDPNVWIETLIVPATADPVLALRREIVPEGAQPDGLIGGAMLRDTETVLDFTEAVEKIGVRVRCLDPGPQCMSLPACSSEDGEVGLDSAEPGRTSCCFGLPVNLISRVVLEGVNKQAPRVEDACCPALSRAAIEDLQTLDLCTDLDLL
jgi:hypothetical protein